MPDGRGPFPEGGFSKAPSTMSCRVPDRQSVNLTVLVALGNEAAKPRRVIVQGEHADPLRRKFPFRFRQKRQQHPLRIIVEAR